MTRVKPAGIAKKRGASSKSSVRRPGQHKIIFESITQDKGKQGIAISFTANAPSGFRFIPAGNPQLTQRCKEYSRVEDKKVYIVSTSRKSASNITKHVHRIGYHFARVVVKKACQSLGVRLDGAGHVLVQEPTRVSRILGQLDNGHAGGDTSSQEQLNVKASDALIDLFPKIPDRDKNQIISRAFKEGKNKVGTAQDLPLPRRVQLAVVAHIRHVHTDYDQLVKFEPKKQARAKIEQACFRKLVEWRGDDETGMETEDMKEILREVIVISDDEEDDDELSSGDSSGNGELMDLDEDSDVEFIACRPIVRELNLGDLSAGRRQDDENDGDDQPYIEDETAKGGRRYVTQLTQPPRRSKKKCKNRKGFHRYNVAGNLQQKDVAHEYQTFGTVLGIPPQPGHTGASNLQSHPNQPNYSTSTSGTELSGVSTRYDNPHLPAPLGWSNEGVSGREWAPKTYYPSQNHVSPPMVESRFQSQDLLRPPHTSWPTDTYIPGRDNHENEQFQVRDGVAGPLYSPQRRIAQRSFHERRSDPFPTSHSVFSHVPLDQSQGVVSPSDFNHFVPSASVPPVGPTYHVADNAWRTGFVYGAAPTMGYPEAHGYVQHPPFWPVTYGMPLHGYVGSPQVMHNGSSPIHMHPETSGPWTTQPQRRVDQFPPEHELHARSYDEGRSGVLPRSPFHAHGPSTVGPAWHNGQVHALHTAQYRAAPDTHQGERGHEHSAQKAWYHPGIGFHQAMTLASSDRNDMPGRGSNVRQRSDSHLDVIVLN